MLLTLLMLRFAYSNASVAGVEAISSQRLTATAAAAASAAATAVLVLTATVAVCFGVLPHQQTNWREQMSMTFELLEQI